MNKQRERWTQSKLWKKKYTIVETRNEQQNLYSLVLRKSYTVWRSLKLRNVSVYSCGISSTFNVLWIIHKMNL